MTESMTFSLCQLHLKGLQELTDLNDNADYLRELRQYISEMDGDQQGVDILLQEQAHYNKENIHAGLSGDREDVRKVLSDFEKS